MKKIFWGWRYWSERALVDYARKSAKDAINDIEFWQLWHKKITESQIIGVQTHTYNERVEKTLELTRDIHGKILDYGCGLGVFAEIIARQTGCKLTGVDINKDYVRIARKAFPHLQFTTDWIYEKDEFDCVVMLETIEHLDNPGGVLDLIRNVLKDGGSLIISTPNACGLQANARNLLPIHKQVEKINKERVWSGTHSDHVIAFDFSTLYRLLKHHGFEYEKHAFFYGWGHLANQLIIRVKKK